MLIPLAFTNSAKRSCSTLFKLVKKIILKDKYFLYLLFNAAKNIFSSIFVVDFKVKRFCSLRRTIKLDMSNVGEEQMNRWFVNKKKASLQWIQKSATCFIRTGQAFCSTGPK